MGFTRLAIKVKNPAKPRQETVGRFLVDCGALYSVLPADRLKALGIKPVFKQSFTLANGDGGEILRRARILLVKCVKVRNGEDRSGERDSRGR